MFTLPEVLYLGVYFTTMVGIFCYTINQLSTIKEDGNNVDNVDKYLSLLDEYLYLDLSDLVDETFKFDKDVESILVYVDSSEVSKFQLLLLFDLFPDTNKIAICLENNDNDVMDLCEELDFKYYNRSTEFLESECSDVKEFMIKYCEFSGVKYCFTNIDNNEIINTVFNSFFCNDYTADIESYEKSTQGDVNVYNIFCNEKIFLNFTNLWYLHFEKLSDSYIDNYYFNQDLINSTWRSNLILTFNQLKKDDLKLGNKVKNLYDNSECKYGVIIKLDNNNLPYWLWENILLQYCGNLNLKIEKQIIQTLYFTINKNRKDDGELLQDWRYNYNNGVFVLYNYLELQNMLDNCDKVNSNYDTKDNSLKSFLNGYITYKVLENTDDDFLNYPEIDLNLDLNLNDKNNNEIFYNFKYKKGTVDSLLSSH